MLDSRKKTTGAAPAVKRSKPKTDPMPSLVDNPQLKSWQDTVAFTAGKARAVANLSAKSEDKQDLFHHLHWIESYAQQGELGCIIQKDGVRPTTITELEKLGYKITSGTEEYSGLFGFPRLRTIFYITW